MVLYSAHTKFRRNIEMICDLGNVKTIIYVIRTSIIIRTWKTSPLQMADGDKVV